MTATKEFSKSKVTFFEFCETSIQNEDLLVFCEYKGLTVPELQELRNKLKSDQATSKVIKNKVAKKAMASVDERPDHLFQNSTLLTVAKTDQVGSVLKTIKEFGKKNECLKIKGGYLDKAYIDSRYLNQLAGLPTKDELIAKLLMLMKSPISRLAMALSSPINKLNLTLTAIKQSKTEE